MRPTSDGVTIGGSVESFERTLERENVDDGQRGRWGRLTLKDDVDLDTIHP
jgi:hypothetical protein